MTGARPIGEGLLHLFSRGGADHERVVKGKLKAVEEHVDSLKSGRRHGAPLLPSGRERAERDAERNLDQAEERLARMNPNQKKSQELRRQVAKLREKLDEWRPKP